MEENINDAWSLILSDIKNSINTPTYKTWFENIVPISFKKNTLNVMICTSTDLSASKITVESGTQGSMPFPVMTASQRTSIAAPVIGLHVYQSDGTEGVYVYKSTGWQFAY